MILRVESEKGFEGVRLDDALDFQRLHAELSDGMSLDVAAMALADAGAGLMTATGEILLLVSWMEDRAPQQAGGADWLESLGRMVDYARERGWYSPETHAVRVHVARGDGAVPGDR